MKARAVLEKLVERGFIEAKGEKRGRIYHLSAQLYFGPGDSSGYVRVRGISALRHEALVMEFVEAHGKVTRKDVMDLCGLSGDQSGRLLRKLEKKEFLPGKDHHHDGRTMFKTQQPDGQLSALVSARDAIICARSYGCR